MSNQRRKLIKGLGLGTAWSTPVIQSMVLPAHAQTSVTTPPMQTQFIYFNGDLGGDDPAFMSETDYPWYVDALNAVVPPALATHDVPRQICVEVDGDMATVTVKADDGLWKGMIPTNGSTGTLVLQAECDDEFGNISASIDGYMLGDAQVTVTVNDDDGESHTVTANLGPCMIDTELSCSNN